jgi:hypothetical protein
MDKVALIILFNHNYESNLDALEKIYGSRFQDIWYIIPFYSGEREDVISVYENSYYFQGYIATALSQLKKKNYDYYFIIADDLYLNPDINEGNFKDYFKVDEDTAFIPGPFLLNNVKETRPSRPYAPVWNAMQFALDFKIEQNGINVKNLLPSYKKAEQLLKNHGLNFSAKISRKMFFSNPILKKTRSFNDIKDNLLRIKLFYKNFLQILSPKRIPYPLIGSYSDILIVSNKHLDKFITYSGSFAALNLFVEIALPSAVAFSYPKMISENDLELKGETYWYYNHHECEKKYKLSLDYLNNNFPDNCLYIHPIKLSKCK